MEEYEKTQAIDLIKAYFSGGNATGQTKSSLKDVLESIRDFVEETAKK